MAYLQNFYQRWNRLSLAVQFLIAGGLGLLAVMFVVGLWVTSQINVMGARTRRSVSKSEGGNSPGSGFRLQLRS